MTSHTRTCVRFSIQALTVLLMALFIGPSTGIRAQEGGPVTDVTVGDPQFAQAALSTAFTYQGRLNDGSNPANGAYDFQFKLWGAVSAGAQVGSTISKNDLTVSSGLFMTELDFGTGAFDGQSLWLEVAVRPGASTGAFTILSPRRALLASPYAQYSSNTRGLSVGGTGNVGIGTSNPQARLEVAGGVRLGTGGTNASLSDHVMVMSSGGKAFQGGLILTNSSTVETTSRGFKMSASYTNGASSGLRISEVMLNAPNSTLYDYLYLNRGRIGMGTTSPQYKLDVNGGVASSGADAGVTVLNPANQQAAVHLSWKDNMARIRIGGDGVGATNGLDIQGPGDESLLTVRGNGSVGIGGGGANIEVLNPGNQLAGVNLGWKDNVARIRIGGDGAGANNGLDIQGVGNVSLLRVRADGTTSTRVLEIRGGSDLAEHFQQTGDVLAEPGTVMVIDPINPGHLKISNRAYDTKVAGIVSGAGDIKPGLTLSQEGVMEGELTVAMAGRVYAQCEASSSPILPGDLLTTSDISGHCMKAVDTERRDGTIIGKAMTGLTEGTGLILVLVNLQ